MVRRLGESGANLSIRQARAIDAVSTYASLAHASERLHLSPSSLSRYIAAAERSLGRPLFQRGWSGMEATSVGEIVIGSSRRTIAHIEAARLALAGPGTRRTELSHRLTWDLLEAVDAVVEFGSVSAAADSLHVSQPSVSRALAMAGSAAGRQLFQRAQSGMVALEGARILSALHAALLEEAVRLSQRLAALKGQATGRVSVGLLPFSEQDVVVKAFGEILHRHKHVRLQAVTGSYAALVDGLQRGELDFVLGILRRPLAFDTLQELPLYEESFAVVARADHRAALSTPSLVELAKQDWIVAPHGTPTRSFFETWLTAKGIDPPAQTCEIVTFHLAEQMILGSNAVGLLTYSDRKRASLRPELRIIPVDLPPNALRIGLLAQRRRRRSPAQQLFLKLLAAEWHNGRD